MKEINELINSAIKARKHAYAPYSNFKVGAALLCHSNAIYTGCNIENAAYPSGCCAERVAIFSAISNGEREFKKMVVIADTSRPIPPCGSCRQVMSEFFNPSMPIHMANLKKEVKTITMNELLPLSFEASDLKRS